MLRDVDSVERTLCLVAVGLVHYGTRFSICTVEHIAKELSCTSGWVPRKATKLIGELKLKSSGRKYVIPTSNGNKTAWSVGGYHVDRLIDLLLADGTQIHVSEWERKSASLGMSAGVFMTLSNNTALEKKPVFMDKKGMVWRDASSNS